MQITSQVLRHDFDTEAAAVGCGAAEDFDTLRSRVVTISEGVFADLPADELPRLGGDDTTMPIVLELEAAAHGAASPQGSRP